VVREIAEHEVFNPAKRVSLTFVPFVYRGCLLLGALVGLLTAAVAAPTTNFATQFEYSQNYRTNLDLAGQNGWIKYGTGGNGVVTNLIAGQGQQAYVGFSAPSAGDSALFLLRPINFSPVAAGLPLVKFTTLVQIVDSGNDEFDFFQWSVYNITGDRLFTLDRRVDSFGLIEVLKQQNLGGSLLGQVKVSLESAEFSAIFWQPVTYAHSRRATAR